MKNSLRCHHGLSDHVDVSGKCHSSSSGVACFLYIMQRLDGSITRTSNILGINLQSLPVDVLRAVYSTPNFDPCPAGKFDLGTASSELPCP